MPICLDGPYPGALHLELRRGSEDLRTAASFAGWNVASGMGFALELAP